MRNIANEMEYWTADQIAECLSVSEALYARLWGISNAAASAGTQTPSGGDGTDGTVETPDGQIGDFGDQGAKLFAQLTDDELGEIFVAYRKAYDV